MGTWGAGLYANDTTCDVKDTYTKFLQEQFSNEDAYQKTIEKFHEYIGDEDEPFLWYALADTQWRFGRLMPEAKEKALEWINKNGGLEIWTESSNKGKGWKKTLQKLKTELESPMPPEKSIKKPVEFIRNPWNTGDVYAYQFHTDAVKSKELFGKYIPFQKVGNTEWCDGWILSAIQVYDCVFDTLPTLNDIEETRILPLVYPSDEYVPWFEWYMKAYMIYSKKQHYPEKYFTYIGHHNIPETEYPGNRISSYYWEKDGMDDWLSDFYLQWHNIEY